MFVSDSDVTKIEDVSDHNAKKSVTNLTATKFVVNIDGALLQANKNHPLYNEGHSQLRVSNSAALFDVFQFY